MESITKSQARKWALEASLADCKKGKGKRATLRSIQHLGYLQIDTISVIERAHHHVLWSRQPDYKSDYLNQLLANDKSVFEHWAHAVAYMPMEDYRFYLPKMDDYKTPPTGSRRREVYDSAKPLFKTILKRIREEGGLASKDFEHVRKSSSEGWWDWKPAKFALEFLYLRGDLMVSARRNFQRVYDLTERVLPKDLDTSKPTAEACAEFQINRALRAMGLAREAEIVKYIEVAPRKVIGQVLREMISSDSIVEVQVRGVPDQIYYAHPESLDRLKKLRNTKRVRILNPFDPLVIQRERMKRLFGFDYTIECYVPAPKRKYGYFVCPVLWGNELVARIDMKADRKARTLLVNSLHYEKTLNNRSAFDEALKEALEDFAKFNGCDTNVMRL